MVDIRDENQVKNAVDSTLKTFGGIDVLMNNASAIQLTNTLDTSMKRYDLMMSVNVRGTYLWYILLCAFLLFKYTIVQCIVWFYLLLGRITVCCASNFA